MKNLLKALNLNLIFVYLIQLILIYAMAEIEHELKKQMISEPSHTRSDSF